MKKHYYLVAGTVMFRDPENEEPNAVGQLTMNVTTRCDKQCIQAHEIGKAQQALQMMMFQKLEDPNLQVLDVIIIGFSYLGHMTEEFFMEPPKGTVMVPTPIDPSLQ